MSEPSADALAMIGKRLTYQGPRGGVRSGICKAVERVPGMTVTDENGKTWPAVRFLISSTWTGAFADRPPPTEGAE